MNTVHIVIQNGCINAVYADKNADIDVEVYDLDCQFDSYAFKRVQEEVEDLASDDSLKNIY